MAKVSAYYDKGQAIPIVSTPGFYAYPIEVEEKVLKQCDSLRALLAKLSTEHVTAGFPRDAQRLADTLADELASIMKAQKRSVKNVSTDEE